MTIFKSLDTSLDLDYPIIDPTLDLNFALTKTLDPRITYTRNSIGTYVGADGYIKTAVANEPRFDHDPLTGKCLGLMVEEERTNYFFAFASPNYNTSGAAVYSAYSDSRFGTAQNAHSWTWTNAASFHELGWFNPGGVSTTGNGVQYTISFWAKANQTYTLNGNVNDDRRQTANFAFGLTTFWQYFTSSTPAGIADNGAGTLYLRWFRNSFNHNIPAGLRIDFAAVNLERGGFPTSYIPTSGSAVTRAADSATITGSNFSQWYNSSEGTLLSIDEKPTSYISLSSSLNILPSFSSTRTISNLLYYPKKIEYTTLKTMNAYTDATVTDGLILNLDAGNPQSYPGNGTTWTDLSGSGNNGTLVGGVGYNSANGGSLVFDGSNDYASSPTVRNSLTTLQKEGSLTYEYWIKPTESIKTGYIESNSGASFFNSRTPQGLSGDLTYNYGESIYVGFGFAFGTNGFVAGVHKNGYAPPILVDYQTYNGISHLVVIKNTTNCSYYINGVLKKTSLTIGGGATIIGDNMSFISANGTDGTVINFMNFFKGDIYSAKFYNRALSAVEVQQNFNSLRMRYGI